MTAGCSATCARGFASCTRASAGCASSARGRASGGADHLRPVARGFCIDPIEKKPLNHFLPGTPVFSFGTAGCNLTCKFCQNWDISKAREIDKLNRRAPSASIAAAAQAVGLPVGGVHLQRSGDIPGIRGGHRAGLPRGGNEDGGRDRRLHQRQPRAEFYEHIDAANVDLKAFTERFYREICAGSLAPVLDTLE